MSMLVVKYAISADVPDYRQRSQSLRLASVNPNTYHELGFMVTLASLDLVSDCEV